MRTPTFVLRTTVCPVVLPLPTLYRMKATLDRGGRIVWDYKGYSREIPAAVILNQVQLAEDYDARTPAPNLDSTRFALTLTWEQTQDLAPEEGLDDRPGPAADGE